MAPADQALALELATPTLAVVHIASVHIIALERISRSRFQHRTV
jgi:hypothetical protein